LFFSFKRVKLSIDIKKQGERARDANGQKGRKENGNEKSQACGKYVINNVNLIL